MAALLKSGKFLRMVTGLARPGQSQPVQQQQHSLLPLNNTNGTGNSGPTLGEKGGGLDSSANLANFADGSATFQPWSFSSLQSALPALAGASQTDEERKEKEDPLLGYLIDKHKVEEFCNKTWSETQKELVELEKELKLERNAIEKKENVEQRLTKESTLKSNAMFTKSRKKKVTSKRKSSIQNKNKELGRPISLNIIYEEPSQGPSASDKEIAEVKVTNEQTIELKHENDYKNDDKVGQGIQDMQKDESIEKQPQSISCDESKCIEDHSSNDSVENILEHNNGEEVNQINRAIPESTVNANTADNIQENSYFPPPDSNWESRLSSLDFSTQGEEHKDSAPISSGVYYSQIQTRDSITEKETPKTVKDEPIDASCIPPTSYVPMVQVFEIEPYTEAHWYPLEVVCRTFREQGRYWDLETLLDGSRGIRPEDRQSVYFWTLQAYADAGMFERAVALSGQLHLEGLGVDFPAYHQLMSTFAAAQQSFAPTLPYSSYAYPDGCQTNSSAYLPIGDGTQTDVSSQKCITTTPSDASLVSTPRSSCPPTPCLPASEEFGVLANDNLRRRYNRPTRGDRNFCKSNKITKSSTERKVSAAAANSVAQHLQRRFKKALNERNLEECLRSYYQMEELNSKRSSSIDSNSNYSKSMVNITDSSSLIELLVKGNRVKDATNVAETILASDAYPIPKIFRFLLNRLASNGEVESMSKFGQYLTPRIKKEVSFDNRLCNAYLAAGRGGEYLHMLQREVDDIMSRGKTEQMSPSRVQSVKDKFPRGGAMGLLESDPQLVEDFTNLAYKFAKLGYIAPMNVLWTYHFIGGRHDIATPLWQEYVQTCPQIMFQKVCQTARSTCNADLAQRLVNVLEDASTVTMGARGIAYSCLIDVLTQNQNYIGGIDALKKGLTTGIKLEDVNRTALKRLKEGLEETTSETFPFAIPKKDGKNESSSIFKHENDDKYESYNSVAMLN